MARKISQNILDRWDYWRKHVEQWRVSGMSQADYCREHGLADQQLSKWKVKIGVESKPSSRQTRQKIRPPKQSLKPEPFVEVKLESKSSESYRIELANGRTLYLDNNFDIESVSKLVNILEQSC